MAAPQETTDTSASLAGRTADRLGGAVFATSAAVALAALGVVALRPDPTPGELALFVGAMGAPTLGLQFRYEGRHGLSVGQFAASAASFVAVVGGAWLLAWRLHRWQAALALLGVVSLFGYGLHRYQLLVLGVLEGSDAS